MKLSYMYGIKRTIHYSAIQWNYSRTALRRMKKSELIDLAQEQRLTIHGTKNDIIDGILASYSPSSPSPPLKPIEKENTTALENKSNKVVVKQEYQNENENENDEKTTATGGNDDDQFDKQWVEAFDLKVSNRRSSIRSFNKDLSSQKVKPLQQNRPVARIEKTISTPVIFDFNSSQNNEIINKENYNNNDNDNDNDNDMTIDDPEINQQWVKAFDQKVKFRASRKSKEVIEITNPTPSLEKEQKKIKHQEKGKEEKPIHHQQQQKIMDHSTDNYHSFDASDKKEQPKSNTIINTMIGSTLLYWYIKGEDGFHNIFSYFTS